MKSNGFKYVFIAFLIIIAIVSVLIIKKDEKENVIEEEGNNQEIQIKELKFGIAEFDSINPILSHNKNVQDISKLIYEPLINIDASFKPEPCLAKEWVKQNDNSYLIKLRENVKWSDGQIFTAEDVKFTIDKIKEVSSIYSYNVQDITEVNIVDDFTVSIVLNGEIPFFEYNLTFPILSKYYYEEDDFSNTPKNNAPVCTGKYKITDAQSSYIVLEKNLSWWNRQQTLSLEKITINLYSQVGELYNSFKMGGLDLISTTNTNLQQYIGTMGYSSKEIKGREHTFLALNTANYFLSREEVRKALSYAIDKGNIVATTLNNTCLTSSFPLDYGNRLYTQDDASAGYNVEAAEQALAEGGWNFRYGTWQIYENYRTQRLELNLLVKASDPSKVAVAENIKAQLANLGILINIIQASDADYSANLASKNYDIALCTVNLSISPNLNTFFGGANLANYITDETNSILNEIKNTTDENVLKERYNRLIEIYKSNVPYISLYNNKYYVAYNTALVGDINPTWYNVFYGIEGWYK